MGDKPISFDPHRRDPEIYSGTPTFMGLPPARDAAGLWGFDAAVMGAPFEGVVTWAGYSGCELAPKAIRAASARYGGFLPELGWDVFDHLKVCDFGDAGSVPGRIDETMELIFDKARAVVEAGVVPITLGGDHSVSVPVVRAASQAAPGRLGIVHLDAHLDNLDRYGEHRQARCQPLHRIYDLDAVDAGRVVHLGIRGPRSNPEQMDTVRQMGALAITSFEMKALGVEQTVRRTLDHVGPDAAGVYITVCSDVLDAAFNPGGPPDPCGLTSMELARTLFHLAAFGLAGFDLVEVYPPSDRGGASAHTAAWMTLYALAGWASGRSGLSVPEYL
jgi:agmatinase